MDAIDHRVMNDKGEEVGTFKLDTRVYAGKVKPDVVHQVVRWQLAQRRAGTHQTLTRGVMRGGGKKPWRQKGTGRARSGSSNSPVWVGGAVAHGPHPRSYDFKLTRKTRRDALRSILTNKMTSECLVIVDQLTIESGKTRDMQALLADLGIASDSVLVMLPEKNELVWRAASNLPNVSTLPVSGVNAHDLLRNKYLLGTEAAFESLTKRVLGQQTSHDKSALSEAA